MAKVELKSFSNSTIRTVDDAVKIHLEFHEVSERFFPIFRQKKSNLILCLILIAFTMLIL